MAYKYIGYRGVVEGGDRGWKIKDEGAFARISNKE